MKTELARTRALRRLGLALGLSLAGATAAQAQDGPPARADYGAPAASTDAEAQDAQEAEPAPNQRRSRRPARTRTDVSAYLEVAQVLSADLGSGGETLTYTSLAVGVDGQMQTRRVTAQISYRYERDIDWSSGGVDRDAHSGLAAVNLEIVPGALSFDAGALATRTGGQGRALGVTNRDETVDVYSAYVGPTLSTNAGPLAINAAYRLGAVWVDDHSATGNLNEDFDSSVAHSATASLGMAPGGSGLPFGWTVGGGYAREDNGGRFDQHFEGYYVRGDVVLPIGATLALTAGVGYENMRADQRNFVRDAGGAPVIGLNGPTPDPAAPRLLTYDLDGVMYDGGIIWRPSPRTELQARAGRRYGSTTVTGSLDHRFNSHQGVHVDVFDSVETFGNRLAKDYSGLGSGFDVDRDPLTGGLGGCVFGGQASGQAGGLGGGGACFDRTLTSITGNSFRMRGGSLLFSGGRGRWSYGLGAGYAHRRYHRPQIAGVAAFAASDEVYSVYGSLSRQLSRTSSLDLNAFASWYDSDVAADAITTYGATMSYNRTFFTEHLQLMAALGLYNSDDGTDSATNASALGGLRYTF
ncbi:MAG TPA: hypothetical protein VMS43_07690 [Allosphingosinicella sp.]|nr:hypothetical protein [Allosphingosinicella sp.]